MKRSIALYALCGLLSVASAQVPAGRSSCEVCHSKAAAEHGASVHGATGLECTDCHGGNPKDMTQNAMARDQGFTGKPNRLDQPAFCARCHAQRSAMRPYGLPTDQYEEYQTSKHGQALAQGNSKVAICTDCHSVHDIRKVTDPRSTVYRSQLPATCARCHSDAKLMGSFGLPSGQYEQYQDSVHGKALLLGQSQAAPNCASCHGSHGAAPPQVESVNLVCGQCHSNTAQAFEAGPHGAAAAAGKMAPCVGCHGAHGIQPPDDAFLLQVCGKCHDGDPTTTAVAAKIHDDISTARAELSSSSEALEEHHGLGLPFEQLNSEVDEAKTALLQTAVAQHSVRLRDVERHTVVVRATADDIQVALKDLDERLQLRVIVILYVEGFLLVSIICFALKRRRAQRAWVAQHRHPGASS